MDWKGFAKGAIGGLAGFALVFAAVYVAVVEIGKSICIVCLGPTGSSFSFNFYILAPVLFAAGVALPAWTLGAGLWRLLLVSPAALMVFVVTLFEGDLGSFPTLAYTCAAAATVLGAATGNANIRPRVQGTTVALSVLFILVASLPMQSLWWGLLVTLLAWILLPGSVALFQVSPARKTNTPGSSAGE